MTMLSNYQKELLSYEILKHQAMARVGREEWLKRDHQDIADALATALGIIDGRPRTELPVNQASHRRIRTGHQRRLAKRNMRRA